MPLVGTHPWLFSKSKLNPKSDRVNLVAPLVLLNVWIIYPMSRRYSTNWVRKGWPGSEIQMYYGCPCGSLEKPSDLGRIKNIATSLAQAKVWSVLLQIRNENFKTENHLKFRWKYLLTLFRLGGGRIGPPGPPLTFFGDNSKNIGLRLLKFNYFSN